MKIYRTESGHTVICPRICGKTGRLRAIRIFNGKTRQYEFQEISTTARISRRLKGVEAVACMGQLNRIIKNGIEFDAASIKETSCTA